MDPLAAISVENLGKCYRLGQHRAGEGLRHRIEEFVRRPFRDVTHFSQRGSRENEKFWALRDVNFKVHPGEVTGVIGRNGAGKSTLLKILSRITEPSHGRVRLRGRVASLLEVGTGFHPELTGGENIFLNGAILGMTRSEIVRKFDEIIAFAEIEKFLDTPVKRYSSGMYVRLAFAVAAHLEPEILLVDEVLAVGDAAFQRKCLGKMREVSQSGGRTVLFVSHNMPAVTQLCGRAVLFDSGKLVQEGLVDDVVAHYLRNCANTGANCFRSLAPEELRKRKRLFFVHAELLGPDGRTASELDVRQPFVVRLRYEVPRELSRVELAVRILTADGRAVMTTLQSALDPDALLRKREGQYQAEIEFPGMFFMPGSYFVNIAAHEPAGELFDLQENVVSFTVQDTGTNFFAYQHYSSIGVVLKDLPWRERQLT